MKYNLAGYEYQAIDLEEYTLTDDMTDEELIECLKDPLFRICNLYSIISKKVEGNTRKIKFTPRWEQRVVLHAIFVDGFRRIAVPKARQLGFSTLFAVILFDQAYFQNEIQASIVDQTQLDATEKLDKVRFAWENMPERLKDALKLPVNNNKEMAFTNNSSVNAGKNSRGGTNHLMHISELGPIAWDDPARSTEIMTGAIPSVPQDGYIFIESTFKGGKGGDWYNILKSSLEVPFELRTERDYLVLFFPWYFDKDYQVYGDIRRVDRETMEYFDVTEKEMRKRGIPFKFNDDQKIFYQLEKNRLGQFIKQEYPTLIEEMWQVREAGLIFAPKLDAQRAAGRVNEHVAYYSGFPAYTAWDIGAAINTKCWIFQVIGDNINFLQALSGGPDCDTPGDWADRLRQLPYRYGGHFLPPDGELLWQKLLQQAGMVGVACVERYVNVWDPIRDALSSFSRCGFSTIGCGKGDDSGLAALDYYHSKEEKDGATIKDVPVHDWSSHYSSAFCTAHQAIREGLLIDRSAIPANARTKDEDIPVTGAPRRR